VVRDEKKDNELGAHELNHEDASTSDLVTRTRTSTYI